MGAALAWRQDRDRRGTLRGQGKGRGTECPSEQRGKDTGRRAQGAGRRVPNIFRPIPDCRNLLLCVARCRNKTSETLFSLLSAVLVPILAAPARWRRSSPASSAPPCPSSRPCRLPTKGKVLPRSDVLLAEERERCRQALGTVCVGLLQRRYRPCAGATAAAVLNKQQTQTGRVVDTRASTLCVAQLCGRLAAGHGTLVLRVPIGGAC